MFNSASSSGAFTISGGPAVFLFATEDGTLAAWNASHGTNAVLVVDRSGSAAVYKGLALGTIGSNSFLYATNHATQVGVSESI